MRRLSPPVLLAAAFALASPIARPAEGSSPPPEPSTGYTTILLYHKFDEPEHPTTNVSTDALRAQLTYLLTSGYRILEMPEFEALLESGGPFPEKSVLITIDDPYRSIYAHAWPVFRELGVPFTLFVWTDGVERRFRDLMTWAEIDSLVAGGVTIGNHTHTHPHLGTPQPGESREGYRSRVRDEIETSQRLLRAHGHDSDRFAYPYGEYNHDVIDVARSLGYRHLYTQDRGSVGPDTPIARIPREAIVGLSDDLDAFVAALRLTPLELADADPDVGFLRENPPPRIRFRIPDPERYAPVVNVFVSELGRVDAQYDASTGIGSVVLAAPLSRPFNRINVSIQERRTGLFALSSRMIFRPFAELTAPADPDR